MPVEAWQALAIFSGLALGFVSLWNVHLRKRVATLSRQIEIASSGQKHTDAESNHDRIILDNPNGNSAHSGSNDQPSKHVKTH